MKKLALVLAVLYLAVLIFTRFYNLPNTARFGEDESGFLARTHQIYQESKITLVGQINQFGTKVFSSLTIYLLLPFAVLGNFDPISLFYGAAIFGILSVLTLLLLTHQINKNFTYLIAVLLIVFFPILQMGRWAWNPNFIPLWISLGLIFYLRKQVFGYFLTGIFFGFAVHQHYYAIFACAIFLLLISLYDLVHKHFAKVFFLSLGFALVLMPFFIFDLRHPPGLFFLGASRQAEIASAPVFLQNFYPFTFTTLIEYAQTPWLAQIILIVLVLLLIWDIRQKSPALLYFVPVFFQIICISALNTYYPHYFHVIIPFLLVWLIYPRKFTGKFISIIAILGFIIGGLISLPSQLNHSPVEPNLASVKKIDALLEDQIQKENIKYANIAVLAAPDHNTHAEKFRYLLQVPYNLSVMSHDEYFSNDLLFVISTGTEAVLRQDPALEMNNFRRGTLLNSWEIDSSPWRVYLFGK